MKTYLKLFLILSLFFCGSATAQTDLAGTWQGKLAAQSNESYPIQFVITRNTNSSYAAVFVSPRNINNASAVQLNGNILTIDVPSLHGSYSGTVGKDTITGEWRQRNGVLPLLLTLDKPDMASLKPLMGEWFGTTLLETAVKRIFIFRFGMVIKAAMSGSDLWLKTPFKGPEISAKLNFFGNRMSGTVKVMEADNPPRYITTPMSLSKE